MLRHRGLETGDLALGEALVDPCLLQLDGRRHLGAGRHLELGLAQPRPRLLEAAAVAFDVERNLLRPGHQRLRLLDVLLGGADQGVDLLAEVNLGRALVVAVEAQLEGGGVLAPDDVALAVVEAECDELDDRRIKQDEDDQAKADQPGRLAVIEGASAG